jgi:hypothetical protein
MRTYDLTPGSMLKMTRVIFFALITGLLFFLVIVYNISQNEFIFSADFSDPLITVTFILGCISIPAGYLIAKKIFKGINPDDLLEEKLAKYQSAQIIRLATCEGVGMLSVVSILLASNLFFLIFLLIALIIMVQYYPTPDKIGREVNLTPAEIEMFNDR